jgi:hypothetical protein
MKRFLPVTFMLVLALTPVNAADDAADAGKLAPLSRFAGQWTLDAKWADGTPLKARAVYEWGLEKKILRAKTFIVNGDEERQRYEDVMAYDPRREALVDVSFSIDGTVNEIVIEKKDEDTLLFGWTPYHADKPAKVRQTIRFEGNDKFVWRVELNAEGEWKQIMEGAWARNRGAAAAK